MCIRDRVIAVQVGANASQLVRVSREGEVTPFTAENHGERWAEPRWSPDGAFIAAIQLLTNGEPVSYTHLDVYKRQLRGPAPAG